MPSRLRNLLSYDSNRRPLALEFRSHRYFILVVISLSVFTDLFLYGIIVPVIPFALRSRVNIPQEHVQYWVSVLLAIYGAALLAASPLCGYLADRTDSRRWPYLSGLLFLVAATSMLCVGTSIPLLVVGRILQGLSAAVVWVVGLALIVDTVGEKDVGQMMGYVSIAMSLAILLAPLLGGVVYASAGYYAVFSMAFGLLGVDIVLRCVMIERKVALKWTKAEEAQPATNSGKEDSHEMKTAKDITADEQQPPTTSTESTRPPLHDSTPPPAPTTPSTNLKWWQKLPPVITLLSSRRLLAGLWAAFATAALITAFDSVLPLHVRHIFSWTSLGAGVIFLALIIPTFASPLVGALADRHGPRYLAAGGCLLGVAPYACLRFVTHDGLTQKVLLCALLALCGTALMLAMAPIMAEVCYAVEAKEAKRPGIFGRQGAYAQAYALFNMAFAAGIMVGPIWAGLINQTAGWGTMAWTLALLSGVTAVPTFLWVGGWVGGKKEVRNSRMGERAVDVEGAREGGVIV